MTNALTKVHLTPPLRYNFITHRKVDAARELVWICLYARTVEDYETHAIPNNGKRFRLELVNDVDNRYVPSHSIGDDAFSADGKGHPYHELRPQTIIELGSTSARP